MTLPPLPTEVEVIANLADEVTILERRVKQRDLRIAEQSKIIREDSQIIARLVLKLKPQRERVLTSYLAGFGTAVLAMLFLWWLSS